MTTIHKYDMDANILPKVLNVLELIIQFSEKKKFRKKTSIDVYDIQHFNPIDCGKSLGKHCREFVFQCIANHRYEETAKLYWILSQDKIIFEHVLFKVGIIVLMNLEANDKKKCFLNFFSFMLNFHPLNKKELLLEFIMCALKCEFHDVHLEVKELEQRKIMSKTRKHDKIDSIFDAYILLLEWCELFGGDMNISQSQTNKEIVKLKKYDENSDIFILKLMKVMEFCDKLNEVEDELLNYVESNPDNVNALIYICTYLYHNKPDSDKLMNYLEILAEKCISDVRTLWLIDIWGKKGMSLLKILNYCFMFLDYPTNGKNIEAWVALDKNLTKAQNELTKDEFKGINSLWESRKRSWTWMYFNPQQLSDQQSDDKLAAHKVAFLLFFNEGKKYIKKVSKCHPDIFQLAKSLRN